MIMGIFAVLDCVPYMTRKFLISTMKYWKTDSYKWRENNPYLGPYKTFEEADDWRKRISAVHTDVFRVIETPAGFAVEQDAPNG